MGKAEVTEIDGGLGCWERRREGMFGEDAGGGGGGGEGKKTIRIREDRERGEGERE